MTELTEYFHSGEGHHSSRNWVCPSSRRNLGKEWSLQPDHVRLSCVPGFVVCLPAFPWWRGMCVIDPWFQVFVPQCLPVSPAVLVWVTAFDVLSLFVSWKNINPHLLHWSTCCYKTYSWMDMAGLSTRELGWWSALSSVASDLSLMHFLASRPVYLFLASRVHNIRIFSSLGHHRLRGAAGLEWFPLCVISHCHIPIPVASSD